jgi:hypothetical protein
MAVFITIKSTFTLAAKLICATKGKHLFVVFSSGSRELGAGVWSRYELHYRGVVDETPTLDTGSFGS